MFSLRSLPKDSDLLHSKLLDQDSFYGVLASDLMHARREVVIESPFISSRRLNDLLPIFQKLIRRKVSVVVNTKPPEEQLDYGLQAAECIEALQEIGVDVLITGGHHRKLAIIDRQILYEGSLNILSQNDSCEVMRRIYSERLATQMINFVGINVFIG